MTEPVTSNISLIVANTGDLVDTWSTGALNPDFVAIDGFLGGVVTISAGSSPITLTVPAGFTATPGAGPTQAQNAVLRFTGALSADVQVTLPMPGPMIVENLTTGAHVLSFRAVASGEMIAVEQGVTQRIYNDGTNVRFVDLPPVGSYLDVCDAAVPGWIAACTKPPYLNCDGTTFSAVTYPYLNSKLGGNTLPDFRGVSPAYLNQGTARITTAVSGIDGDTLFSFGSTQSGTILQGNLPAVTLTTTITDPGHGHPGSSGAIQGANSFNLTNAAQYGGNNTGLGYSQQLQIANHTTGITASTALGGSGTSFNRMGPTTIAGLRLILSRLMFGEVRLKPGVSVDWTPTLNEAGISQSQLIRFRDGLCQKYGGWTKFYPFALSGVPRELHAWQDLNATDHLAVGTTTSFNVITGSTLQNVTPQTLVSNFTPKFSTVINTKTVTVDDSNIATVTTFDSVFFDTPIAVGGIILSGLYPIVTVTGTTTYTITAATAATGTVTNGGAVPVFTPTSASSVVSVDLTANGMSVGSIIAFSIPTTSAGITISGAYPATTITDADNFEIQVSTQASSSTPFSMNGGNARLTYYIALGPAAGGIGYGLGAYGAGGYGTGVVPSVQTGTAITATDWTSDNWGQLIVGCPANGGIYYWDPTGGFSNMSLVSSGPIFNSGMFISTSEQILVTYGSTIAEQIGVVQDPMLVQWSDSGDFFNYTPTGANFAGNFRIPIGSEIRAGMAGPANQNLIWTDLDLWAMNFIGQPDVFGFTQIGAGAGAAGRHAIQKLRGGVHWMGTSNFFQYDGGGMRVVPCPVWDAVFQNLNLAYAQNIRAMPNTPFNEAGYLYPSLASSSGENDSYVKYNITEPGQPWDYGLLARSAWIDQSVFGNPIAAVPGGVVYRQESGPDADGQPLVASFVTAYFYLSEGEEFVSVDKFYPDFIWQTYPRTGTSAQIQVTFNVVDFPGDTPRTFGPYTVTSTTKYIDLRFRSRQVSMTFASSDVGSFYRMGKCRFRFSTSGRR